MKLEEIGKLRAQFEKETDVKVINSQGEFDIDYVDWLENKVLISHDKIVQPIPLPTDK